MVMLLNQLLGVVEEVGELSHSHLKAEQQIRGTQQEHWDKKIDAIGDIVIFLCGYCNKSNISLEEAIKTTWENTKQRDWIKYPKNGLTE